METKLSVPERTVLGENKVDLKVPLWPTISLSNLPNRKGITARVPRKPETGKEYRNCGSRLLATLRR